MTYLVIGICVFLLITVIIIAAKPISMGIEARRNINNNNDDEKEKENNDVYQTDESNYKISDEIEKLNQLRKVGAISDEEFKKAKKKLLD
tara:strand:+ start:598 stop:867 length:270 start_codon:yes stop_codon:yes gene_type:complete